MNEIYKIFCIICMVQALFLALILLAKKNNKKANRFAAIGMLLTTIDLFEVFLTVQGVYDSLPVYPLSIIPYQYIFGPCIYFYAMYIISKLDRFSFREWLFFLPAAIVLLINLFILFYSDSPGTLFSLDRNAKLNLNLKLVNVGVIYASVLYLAAFYHTGIYTRRLKEFFSDINRLQVLWLRIIIAAIFWIELSVAVLYHKDSGGAPFSPGIADLVVMFFSLLLVFTFAFLAIIQPELLSRIRIMNSNLSEKKMERPRYEKLRLGPEREEEIVSQLKLMMNENRPYLNEDITLADMAKQMSINTHQLSMILNLHLNMNFYTFINSYRVEQAKEILSLPENNSASILSIAYRSGFNSKSTFNSMFKKITGITPTQYRTSLQCNKKDPDF